MNSRLAVLVTPRSGPPYQELLYRYVEAVGVRVHYAVGPTPSQTVNIILMPAVLVWRRVRGDKILHIHWVFQFYLPWARRKRWARKLMERWFGLYLRTAQLLAYGIIWTAHDLLPHEQVFENDVQARKVLLSRATLVIALSKTTADELIGLGARDVRVIPMGSYAEPYPVTLTRAEARTSFGFDDDDVVISLIGIMDAYKGADLLLRAAAQLPATSRIKILLAGSCRDPAYREELTELAREARVRVTTHFEWVPNADLARFLQATDFSTFPFREITNSGSIMLAQSFGLPVIIPNLAMLNDIPEATAIRFDSGATTLTDALHRAELLSSSEYSKMSAAALEWANRTDWTSIARDTLRAYESALSL